MIAFLAFATCLAGQKALTAGSEFIGYFNRAITPTKYVVWTTRDFKSLDKRIIVRLYGLKLPEAREFRKQASDYVKTCFLVDGNRCYDARSLQHCGSFNFHVERVEPNGTLAVTCYTSVYEHVDEGYIEEDHVCGVEFLRTGLFEIEDKDRLGLPFEYLEAEANAMKDGLGMWKIARRKV